MILLYAFPALALHRPPPCCETVRLFNIAQTLADTTDSHSEEHVEVKKPSIMSTLLAADRDDLIHPHSLQPRFIESENLYHEPMSDYFEDAEFSSTATSKLNFRPALVSPVYTPTLSSLSSEVTSDGEGDELALPAFETESSFEHQEDTEDREGNHSLES